jgi:hypothetical protein
VVAAATTLTAHMAELESEESSSSFCRLAFLAPKIVEAIAERGELADLKLTPHVDLPLYWTTQKRVVGLE